VKTLESDIKLLIQEADAASEEAKNKNNMSLVTKSNALRHWANEKK